MNKLKVLVLFLLLLGIVSCAGGNNDLDKQMSKVSSNKNASNNDVINEDMAKNSAENAKVTMKAQASDGKNVNFTKVSIINFGFDKDSIAINEEKKLVDQASWLLANPNVTVTIEGHTDYIGTSEYNLALGERRANATKEYLVKHGIDASRITTVSYGKDKPVNKGNSNSARAENRRTVTVR